MNYLAVSANVAMEGSNGDPEKYEIFLKYEGLPTLEDYDTKSSLTASDSYVGNVLYRYGRQRLFFIPKLEIYQALLW